MLNSPLPMPPATRPSGADHRPSLAVGPSLRMKALYDFLRIIEFSESTVLITGETGTGKEVIARRIHDESRRRARPFVAVSCALFSDTLIESELFGHERGAFTGAISERPGRFELANHGTLFLDDIDDIPLSMQVKLLRVLQNRTIERLGGTRTVAVNVRVIGASKKDLREMVAAGTFREDLYYRLNVIPLSLPPLRARTEDIPALMDHFLSRAFQNGEATMPVIPSPIRAAFERYAWPGNIRELENACERLAVTLNSDVMRGGRWLGGAVCGDADGVFSLLAEAAEPETGAPVNGWTESLSLDEHLDRLEAELIARALRDAGGNKSRAAALLKVQRSTLGDRMKRLEGRVEAVAWASDRPFVRESDEMSASAVA